MNASSRPFITVVESVVIAQLLDHLVTMGSEPLSQEVPVTIPIRNFRVVARRKAMMTMIREAGMGVVEMRKATRLTSRSKSRLDDSIRDY